MTGILAPAFTAVARGVLKCTIHLEKIAAFHFTSLAELTTAAASAHITLPYLLA